MLSSLSAAMRPRSQESVCGRALKDAIKHPKMSPTSLRSREKGRSLSLLGLCMRKPLHTSNAGFLFQISVQYQCDICRALWSTTLSDQFKKR